MNGKYRNDTIDKSFGIYPKKNDNNKNVTNVKKIIDD